MRSAIMPPLLLLSACAAAHVRTSAVGDGASTVREAAIEVVNATGRELPASRPGAFEEISRAAGGGTRARFSTADAFAAAAATELAKRGVSTVTEPRPGIPLLRITLLDFEIRNQDAAGAVAFVSAKYSLLDGRQEPLGEAVETRLPIRLGGPDLTRSEVARIAGEAVNRGLTSLLVATP